MGPGGEIVIYEHVITELAITSAVIRISDSGPGVPAGLQEKIMQPFFTTKDEGTGLGLSIAARIIAEHAGRLEVASLPARGAAFSIILPIKEPARGHNPHHR
jgi:signal transduction histidine kinase